MHLQAQSDRLKESEVTIFSLLAAVDYNGDSTSGFKYRLQEALAPFDFEVPEPEYRRYLEPQDLELASEWIGRDFKRAEGIAPGDVRAVLSRFCGETIETEDIDGEVAYFHLSTRNRARSSTAPGSAVTSPGSSCRIPILIPD